VYCRHVERSRPHGLDAAGLDPAASRKTSIDFTLNPMESFMQKSLARSLALVAAAALTLPGCPAGSQAEKNDGETVLTMSAWADDPMAAALIEQFEKDNPGVTIDYTGLPWPNILTQISTEMTSGTASDIVVAFSGRGNALGVQNLAKGNYIADLSDSSWADAFSGATRSAMGVDDKVLFGSNALTMVPAIYNVQALEAVGATAPTTFDEVLDLCAAAKSQGKVAYALAALAGGNYTSLAMAMATTLVYGVDPEFTEEQLAGDATFSDSDWTEVFDKLGEMNDAGCFTADATGVSLDIAQGQVAKGEAVGIVDVTPAIANIASLAPEGTTFETAPFPATNDPADTKLPVGFGAGYAVNAKSKNIDLAKKFVDFYMSQEGLNIALESGSIYPSVPVDGYTAPDALAGIADLAHGDSAQPLFDATWPNASVGQAYSDGIQGFLTGQLSRDEILKRMDAAFTG
jgi:raffinose/stachyose/melibiose transport system substrate-binding protein